MVLLDGRLSAKFCIIWKLAGRPIDLTVYTGLHFLPEFSTNSGKNIYKIIWGSTLSPPYLKEFKYSCIR
jgi:hypothetical protein